MQSRRKLILKIAAVVLAAAALILIGVFGFYMLWEKPPEVQPEPEPMHLASDTQSPKPTMDAGTALDTDREDGVYTILLAGSDNGTGNTDTIMVGKLDTVQHKMDFVSIPRDTVVNVDWSIRKLNSVYWGAINDDGDGAEALKRHVRWLTGFNVDCYAVIDLSAFIDVVDALGGVDVDVKQAIDYEDPYQNMWLHLTEGEHHLNGYESMCYVRYRAGYITGDLGRIETQQGFLRDAAKQFISLGSIPNAGKVVSILSERTDTDLSGPNIAFFMRQAMKCRSEDVNFYIMPSTDAFFQGYSYAVPLLGDWLDMVNSVLNPYETPVGAGNLNMIFKSGDSVACTGEMKGAWYFVKPAPTVEPIVPTETPTVEPILPTAAPTPAPTAAPTPEQTPVPTEEPGVTPAF